MLVPEASLTYVFIKSVCVRACGCVHACLFPGSTQVVSLQVRELSPNTSNPKTWGDFHKNHLSLSLNTKDKG